MKEILKSMLHIVYVLGVSFLIFSSAQSQMRFEPVIRINNAYSSGYNFDMGIGVKEFNNSKFEVFGGFMTTIGYEGQFYDGYYIHGIKNNLTFDFFLLHFGVNTSILNIRSSREFIIKPEFGFTLGRIISLSYVRTPRVFVRKFPNNYSRHGISLTINLFELR